MEIHFHGATRTVTGSLHEIRAAGKTFLLDCGLFQGPRTLSRKINCCFDFDPRKLDFVILSHGHIDHCGNLPNLVKQGYRGPIYCTPATAAITTLMLMDSAKIQMEDAGYLNKKGLPGPRIEPLYTQADADDTIALFEPIDYRQPKDLGGVIVEMRDAGHTLGSASVSVTESSTGKILVFTGDIGRPHSPVVREPDPFTHADALISECTYGGRTHGPMSAVAEQLATAVNATMQRGGVLIVPAFALGRTQSMLEQLHELRNADRIPATLPIFVDSPLATRLTDIHRRFQDLMDEPTRALLKPFDFPNLTYIGNTQESIALNARKDPFVVISASGMCESGRVLHHLKHHIADNRSTVLLPGYQAQGTLGRKIQERMHQVPILGDIIPLRCHVEMLNGLSAHADEGELLAYTQTLKGAKIYLVHGEVPSAEAHQSALAANGFGEAVIATRGDIATV
jgi:metallo-beta-lactamase family protein